MRYTFTNEVKLSNVGQPQAIYHVWMMNGFGPWKKRSDYGEHGFSESTLKNLYIYFSSGDDKHHGTGAYYEERVDMNEFLKGYKAIQAYRELNSG